MTVAELIAKLQEMPQDAEVLTYDDGDGGFGAGFSDAVPTFYATPQDLPQWMQGANGWPVRPAVIL